jgi:hypothetical protein
MNLLIDREILLILGGILALLSLGSLIGWLLDRRAREDQARLMVANLNARTRSWWVMTAVFIAALATGGTGSVILFTLISFIALREFITLTPTRHGDHRSLFWAFFIITPVQYLLVGVQWYGLFRQDLGVAPHPAGRQPQQDLGRHRWRHPQCQPDRRCTLVDHALHPLGSGWYLLSGVPGRLWRRLGDVGDQA